MAFKLLYNPPNTHNTFSIIITEQDYLDQCKDIDVMTVCRIITERKHNYSPKASIKAKAFLGFTSQEFYLMTEKGLT